MVHQAFQSGVPNTAPHSVQPNEVVTNFDLFAKAGLCEQRETTFPRVLLINIC